MSGLFLTTREHSQSRIQLRTDGQTVWLTQLDMAELFQTSKQNIAKHLKAIFADGELRADSVVNPWLTTAADGKSYQTLSAQFRLSREATIKQSLTVKTGTRPQATTEVSSVVRLKRRRQIQRPAASANSQQATRWLTLAERPT